jgi:AraC family transcriptional regulator of adaptative response/methylated-DNA-[protein]-cysteine methyltransferase
MQPNLFSRLEPKEEIEASSIQLIPMMSYSDITVDWNVFYRFDETPFGKILIANTSKGICWLAFVDEDDAALNELFNQFQGVKFIQQSSQMQTAALSWFKPKTKDLPTIMLHVKGSDFQLQVWRFLLAIPFGETITYKELADKLGLENGARAIGNAVGKNVVAGIIPCHRVLPSNGKLSGYRWGVERKRKLLQWELELLA